MGDAALKRNKGRPGCPMSSGASFDYFSLLGNQDDATGQTKS